MGSKHSKNSLPWMPPLFLFPYNDGLIASRHPAPFAPTVVLGYIKDVSSELLGRSEDPERSLGLAGRGSHIFLDLPDNTPLSIQLCRHPAPKLQQTSLGWFGFVADAFRKDTENLQGGKMPLVSWDPKERA